MSAYEGSKMQEEDENRLKFSSKQAVDLAVTTVKGMGIAEAHKSELENAYHEGYRQALKDIQDKIIRLQSQKL